jgi:hypothetical protein
MDDRVDPVVIVQKGRERGDRIQRTAVLLKDLTAVGADSVARDRPKYCDTAT